MRTSFLEKKLGLPADDSNGEAVKEVVDLDVTSNLHLDIVLQDLLSATTPVQQPTLQKQKQCS